MTLTFEQAKDFGHILTRIFNQDIEVSQPKSEDLSSDKYYIVLHEDNSLRMVLPYEKNSHLLTYLSPTRVYSKTILVGLKILYKIRLLGYLNNVITATLHGIDEIDWQSFGWKQEHTPEIFALVGTQKESQNAVIFLDHKGAREECLVLKVSINKSCNLRNEYFTGKSIAMNNTEYVVFNDEKNFLTQKYKHGYRKIGSLNRYHIDYLSQLIIKENKKSGSSIKIELRDLIKNLSIFQEYDVSLIDNLIENINEENDFYHAETHGDFSPYNIIYSSYPESFSVIDWENSSLKGLALVDLMNYIYIRDCLFENKGSKKLEPSIVNNAKIYFSNIGHEITMREFYDYRIIFVISEFVSRLLDAGTEDVYVQYLYKMIKDDN